MSSTTPETFSPNNTQLTADSRNATVVPYSHNLSEEAFDAVGISIELGQGGRMSIVEVLCDECLTMPDPGDGKCNLYRLMPDGYLYIYNYDGPDHKDEGVILKQGDIILWCAAPSNKSPITITTKWKSDDNNPDPFRVITRHGDSTEIASNLGLKTLGEFIRLYQFDKNKAEEYIENIIFNYYHPQNNPYETFDD